MRTLLVLALVVAALLLGSARLVRADPDLPNIPPHRHFIVTATGARIAVGPEICGNPELQAAFNQFHSNVHHAVPGSTGPEASAPGLHNGYGAEITATGC